MLGRTLNHYKIVQSLGSGGMGEVYVAEDTKLNRKVALKVLPPELARDEERRQRFEREAKAVATLNHPNIVTIYSVEEDDGVHFITMELVRGKSITASIPRDGMRLSQVMDIGVSLADGVAAAHEQGITHRDHLQEVDFDAESGKTVGPRRWVMQGPRLIKNPDLSADGEWFVFDSIDNKQEDLFVTRGDGTGLSQITQDVYKDRAPRWSPDGEKIAFLSDRSGRYEAWTINPDGSGLEQITRTSEVRWAQAPLWSPDGTWIAVNLLASAPIIFEVGKPWNQPPPQVASPGGDLDAAYFAWSWSPDGGKIAGAKDGIIVFDRETEQLEQLTDFGLRPIWLNDGRRLIFLHEDKIHLVDSLSKETTEVLSVAPHRLQSLGISKDNRRLYFSVSMTEADIWLASIQ